MPEWITTEEAAAASGYHPEYIRELARDGKIGAEKKSGVWWIDRDRFMEYVNAMLAVGTWKFGPRGPTKAHTED